MTALEDAWQRHRLAILSTLARRFHDIELAEDALQEAFLEASRRWTVDGVPDKPAAWLTTTAYRKAIDSRRRDARFVDAPLPEIAMRDDELERVFDYADFEHDTLGLIFACAHPSIDPSVRVALTLRHVGNLTVEQIASAFLLTESALQKRLVRARKKLRDVGVSFAIPPAHQLAERLDDVLTVIYLIFSEGYYSRVSSESIDFELAEKAIELARALHRLLPRENEVRGLLALLLVQHSRRDARVDASGNLIRFDDQDRALWDVRAIQEATALLAKTGATPPGRFQFEAAIALIPAISDPLAIPWSQIARLYEVLVRRTQSPVARLNFAYALARAGELDHARSEFTVAQDQLPSGRYGLVANLKRELF